MVLRLFGCMFALIPVMAVSGQTSKTTSPNVKFGTLVSVDSEAATLVLKPKTGADITYRLTEKTKVLRDRKAVESSTFKAGDSIVVRFRKSSVGPASLYDLTDRPSWDWLSRIRRETTQVTIQEINEDALEAVDSGAPIAYRITEKTSWAKSGKPSSAADFKAGEKVYVVPRLLPSGGIMAIAVSDSTDSAAKLKERSRIYVTGTVKVINPEKRLLNLQSVAGDNRELPIAESCVVRKESKDQPLSAVKPGQTVTVRLARDDENEQHITRITIQTKKAAKSRPPAPAKKTPLPAKQRP